MNKVLKKTTSIVGIVLCVVLIPILIMNLTIIVKSYISPDKVPDFFGIKPFIVLSGSMEKTIMTNDLVIVKKTNPATLKAGDIISFKERNAVVTHRIVRLEERDGETVFITKGDNIANSEDNSPVTFDMVEGKYLFRIPGVGGLAMFMQTPIGMFTFVGIPLLGFILYDILRRRLADKKENSRNAELLMEIERLKAEQEEKSQSQNSDV